MRLLNPTMKFRIPTFNIYLLALACLAPLGCQTDLKGKKPVATLRLHLEVNRDGTDKNEPVPIFRENPIWINVEKSPFLTEVDVVEAKVIEELGGYSIQVRFERHGRLLLENVSATNNQKHCAVFSQFPEPRWLGAPIFTRRISDGIIRFVPDATREEADHIVAGLNVVAKEVRKKIGKSWPDE